MRTIRMIVTGPTKCDDYDVVERIMDRVSVKLEGMILITSGLPDKEHIRSFPLIDKWFMKKNRRDKNFRFTVIHYPEYSGNKKWSKGMHEMRVHMIQDADALIAFLDVGGTDTHTEELIRLARIWELKLKVVLL